MQGSKGRCPILLPAFISLLSHVVSYYPTLPPPLDMLRLTDADMAAG